MLRMKGWKGLKCIVAVLLVYTGEGMTRRLPLLGHITHQLLPLVGIIQRCHNNVANTSFNLKMLLASRRRSTKGLLPRRGEGSLRSAIPASQWVGLPQLLNTHVVTNRRRYVRVLPDVKAVIVPLLVFLGVLLVIGARIALLLMIIRVLLDTRVLTDLGIMILLPRGGLER
jgi:hypothetical protein